MKQDPGVSRNRNNRRAFIRNGMLAVGTSSFGASLFSGTAGAFDREEGDRAPVTRGDIAILRFLSALEQVESDLWIQYAELGGPSENVPGTQGLSPTDLQLNGKKVVTGLAPAYITGLFQLDGDMPQYIADNTDDEISHHVFLNNYVQSKGGKPVDLSSFATLPPSRVTGVPQNPRLTNLKQLTVDTSWWTRYRSDSQNPDLGGTFENAVPDLAKGQHPAIPVSDDDLVLDSMGNISTHLQAIANTAGFHFAFIEGGGTSLYPSLAQKVSNLEVLRVLLSIGPTETMHFQTWQDKAGNAPQVTDGDLSFPDLNSGVDPNNGKSGPQVADLFQTNLIMPEPTFFLNPKFGPVSIIRPTNPHGVAMGAVKALTDDGLFIDPATNKNSTIVGLLVELAEEADEARRHF
jgi:Ferritin-like domain